MIELSKIRNYSQALFEVGKEEDKIDKILTDLKIINELLSINKEMEDYLINPEVKLEDKDKKLKEVFGNDISEYSYNFFFEIIKNKELGMLESVLERLKDICYKYENKTEARVVTASELSEKEGESIIKKIEDKTGKKVELKSEVDPSILGGMILRVGDEMVDLSVRGKLESLKQNIIN